MSPFLLPKERVIQLTMDASFDAVGLSGCPILSVRNNAVFALQVAQPEATNKMLFAVPLHEIRKRSKLFRELINASIRQTRTWSVFDLDRRTKGRYRDDSPRYIHIIEPADHRHDGARLLEELRSNWPQFCKAIAESLDSALLSLGIQNRIFLSRPELTIAIERIDDKLGNYLDSSRLGANPKLQRTRWVCDLTNTVDFSNGMPLKSMSEASHLIGITFDKTEVVVHGTKIDNLSCFYAIPPTDAAHFVSNIRYVMEDVMLDIALFHATRILKDCYNTTELLRVFSERKVDFAREENLLLYGTCIPTSGDLGYISFAGCCRNKLGGRVNMLLLHDLWHRFVDKFLLMSLSPREKSSTPKMPKALLLARITGARKIGGQINRRKLTNQLNKFNAREGELCAVAVIRKPWRGKKRRKMKGVFGSVKPNSTLICREIKIPTLLGFGNNIDIFFFRWLDSKMMEVQI